MKLIICPKCKHDNLTDKKDYLVCNKCGEKYAIREGILVLKPQRGFETWDELYKKRNFKKEIKQMRSYLNNKRVLDYYIFAGIIKRNGLKLKNSLEIGSGLGKYSLVLKNNGLVEDVYMVDFSFESLLISKKIFDFFGLDGNFILADARRLPFKDKSFDLTFSGGLLEHYLGKEKDMVFSEHHRLSNKVIFQVPTNSFAYWFRRIIATIIYLGWPFGFENPISFKQLKNFYKKNNMKIVDCDYHDFLTASLFILSNRIPFFSRLIKKGFFSHLLRSDIVVYGSS